MNEGNQDMIVLFCMTDKSNVMLHADKGRVCTRQTVQVAG